MDIGTGLVDPNTGIAILMFATLGFGLVVPYLSIRGMQKLRESGAPKSSLSRDGIEERLAARGMAKRSS